MGNVESTLIALSMRLKTIAFILTVLAVALVYLAEAKPRSVQLRPKTPFLLGTKKSNKKEDSRGDQPKKAAKEGGDEQDTKPESGAKEEAPAEKRDKADTKAGGDDSAKPAAPSSGDEAKKGDQPKKAAKEGGDEKDTQAEGGAKEEATAEKRDKADTKAGGDDSAKS